MPVVSTPVKKRPFHAGSPTSRREYIHACERDETGEGARETMGSGSDDFECIATVRQGAHVDALHGRVVKEFGDQFPGARRADPGINQDFR